MQAVLRGLVSMSRRPVLMWLIILLSMITYAVVKVAWSERFSHPLPAGQQLTLIDWVMMSLLVLFSIESLIVTVVGSYLFYGDHDYPPTTGFAEPIMAMATLLAAILTLTNYLNNPFAGKLFSH